MSRKRAAHLIGVVALVLSNCCRQTLAFSPRHPSAGGRGTSKSQRYRSEKCLMKAGQKSSSTYLRWDDMYPELVEFVNRNGHARPNPDDYPELHRWTNQVRNYYRHHHLNPDNPDPKRPKLKESKFQSLQKLNFDWSVDELSPNKGPKKWRDMIPQLEAFYLENGHSHPTPEQNPELYRWTQQLLNNYRHQFMKGTSVDRSRPRLSAEKVQILQRLDFDWNRTVDKFGWEDMFPQLEAFYLQHGHSRVDKNENPLLYRWIQRMRSNYRHKYLGIEDPSRPKIKQEKFLKLKDFGLWDDMTFTTTKSSSPTKTKRLVRQKFKWDDMIPQLQAHYDKYGHTNIDRKEYPNLYSWTQQIRKLYYHQHFNTTTPNQPKLADYKFRKLQSLKFDWNSQRRRKDNAGWDIMFPQLQTFYDEHGHPHPDRKMHPELYQWAQKMRSEYRKGILAESYVRKLEEMHFAWSLSAVKWEKSFKKLCDFQLEHGHPHPKSSQNRQLYVFVQNQRREYKKLEEGEKSDLTEDRYERLVAIGLEWYRSHESTWENRYEELLEYIEEHGHCNVPPIWGGNYQLGLWCMNQRTAYRLYLRGEKSAMTEDRIKLLDEIAFIWNHKDANWRCMYQRLKEFQQQNGDYKISTGDGENADLRLWLIRQRRLYRTQSPQLTAERIKLLESLPKFSWRGRSGGPTKKDWSKLFAGIREKGILPGMRPKMHWFEGINPFEQEVKTSWTEEELIALWNEEEEDDEDDFDFPLDEDYESPLEEEEILY